MPGKAAEDGIIGPLQPMEGKSMELPVPDVGLAHLGKEPADRRLSFSFSVSLSAYQIYKHAF